MSRYGHRIPLLLPFMQLICFGRSSSSTTLSILKFPAFRVAAVVVVDGGEDDDDGDDDDDYNDNDDVSRAAF